MTAKIIPNAIEVRTLHATHSFSSFIARDASFALLVAVWKHVHPEGTSAFRSLSCTVYLSVLEAHAPFLCAPRSRSTRSGFAQSCQGREAPAAQPQRGDERAVGA